MEGIMAEGKAYYKDYDVEIPETLSAYGYGDSPLTFVSLSDYNGMRKLQGMDSVDLLENNYRILYNKENVRGLAEQFHDKSINLTIEENVLSPVNEAEEFTMSNSDMGQIIFVVADTWMKNMNVDTMIWNVQCVSEDAAKEFDTLLDNYQKKSKRECAFAYYVGKQQLIKQGINPLEMKISDLNRVAEQVRSEVGKDDNQKFSEYLYKLEKNNQITEEERRKNRH